MSNPRRQAMRANDNNYVHNADMTDTLAPMEDKENYAPQLLGDLLDHRSSSWSPVKAAAGRKGRSKSIGPGGLDEIAENVKKDSRQEAKNRRKSTYVPATKAIISADAEKTARQAARRKTLEATLHTWDVVEFMRDQTTSTDSSGDTRRGSNITHDHTTTSDTEDEDTPSSLVKLLPTAKRPRSSGIPPMNFNNPEDAASSSEVSSGSEISGSEDEQEDEDEDEDEGEDRTQDATGTAMSLDADDATLLSQSSQSTNGSTGSSARLEALLRLAAEQAGTRGIDYDENGDGDLDEEVSMELAEDGITNAFQPWAAQAGLQTSLGSATMDQENINPFSPAFKADMMSTIEEEETGEMSMEVTRAVGNILHTRSESAMDSPSIGIAMDTTQAFGKIHEYQQDSAQAIRGYQKRRRTTSEAGSPGEVAITTQASKRRRASAAMSSMGDDTMDLTTAVGSINNTIATSKISRRKSMRHRSSDALSEQDDTTMDFTKAIGSIQNASRTDHTASSFDDNEELTMELTTVLGGIKEAQNDAFEAHPVTPEASQSPLDQTAETPPISPDRFMRGLDSGPTNVLTPLLQKQVTMLQEPLLVEQRKSVSPSRRMSRKASLAAAETIQHSFQTDQALPVTTDVGSKHDVNGPWSSSAVATGESLVRTPVRGTPDWGLQVQLDAQFEETTRSTEPSPTAPMQQRSLPAKSAVDVSLFSRPSSSSSKDELPTTTLPQTSSVHHSPLKATTPRAIHIRVSETLGRTMSTPEHIGEARTIVESIKLMNTPRKEVLKTITPRKQTQSSDASLQRMNTPHDGLTSSFQDSSVAAPSAELAENLAKSWIVAPVVEKVHLQAFLELAQIRFMELTMTKRRMTTAATPSKTRKTQSAGEGSEISLDAAVVAGACSTPELEMYRHACHELKHYISDGKKVIKQLENETYDRTPPLLRAYLEASQDQSSDDRRHALDTQMRDMKTHARFRSKELWYAWRTQLLEDLVKALSGIAEGLIRDDEVLRDLEQIVGEGLPTLISREETLSLEAQQLQQAAVQIPETDRLDLQQARKKLVDVNEEIELKQRLLSELREQDLMQEQGLAGLLESKSEFNAAIQEAERIREACRGVSLQEIASLKDSITSLKETYGWSITSAEASPQTVTMTYKSQLQLYFHPLSFNVSVQRPAQSRPNAPIRLTYIAQDGRHNPKELTTTLRFFHQLLRASLQALPQYATEISDLLNLVSGGWDTALSVAEAERSLQLVCPTNAHIISDERLAIESCILLPAVRTKIRVAFELQTSVGSNGDDEAAGLQLSLTIEPSTTLVYGQTYNEAKMSKTIMDGIDNVQGWGNAVKDLKDQLIIHGARKGILK
nr:kinetochore protein spc7 [Quercus suber]